MALYKVLSSYEVENQLAITGFAYTAVPATNNAAGVPWRTVIAEKRGLRPNRKAVIEYPEGVNKQALDRGDFYEWSWTAHVPLDATPAESVAAVEAKIEADEANIIDRISEHFKYWGFTGDTNA